MAQVPQSDWKIFLHFMSYLKPIWDKVLLMLLLAVVLTAVDINTVILPLLVRKFIDQVLAQQDWYMFKILVVIIIIQIVLYITFFILSELVKYVISIRLGISLGMHVFKHVLRLPLNFFQKRPIGEHMYRIGTVFDPGFANLAIIALLFELTGTAKSEQQPLFGKDIDAVLGMLTQSLDLIIRVTFRLLLILFTITVGFNREVGIALFLFSIPYIWVIHKLYNVQRRIDFKYRAKSQDFLAGLQEWFSGIRTIKAYARGKSSVKKNVGLYVKMLRVEFQNFFVKLGTDNYIFFFRYLFIVAALFYMAIKESQSAGAIFALYLLLDQFFSPINLVIRVIEGIRLQLVPARRLMETMNEKPTILEKEDSVVLKDFKGPYHLKDVSFHYVPEKKVLSDITLTIPRGRKIGIVGPSGSGKTSLVNLLMRFYDPDSGAVYAEDVDLRDLQRRRYYENIGIILQEDFLFNGTVRENIRYGKPNAGDQEIIAAAKAAAIHDDILALSDGYDTDLGEDTRLSGGQRQRIAIARALIREPKILILDEATSSLDSQTAFKIEETLYALGDKLTLIMITHKLSSVRKCDRIFVLNHGKLEQQGTFDELAQQDGLFKSLYQKQMLF
ncbi:ATP-binding cassette domain-containing protein [candidate division KSB1 bacterium]|nr:ATP-binding cassette domain-containing protein [candidate division KSB1 bacterium]